MRTGSSGSSVGPAVTRTRRPASGRPRRRPRPGRWLRRSPPARPCGRARTRRRPWPLRPARPTHPVGLQGGQVAAGGRVGPHAHVHRRGHQHRLVGGQEHGRGQVVGQAVGGLGHQVGGGGNHHQQVCRARQLDMAHLGLGGQREQLVIDLVLGQGRQRQRGDEVGAAGREHRAHGDPGLAQQADQLQRLIGGDAAAHDQQNAFVVHGARPLIRRPLHSVSIGSGQTPSIVLNLFRNYNLEIIMGGTYQGWGPWRPSAGRSC